MHSTGEMLTRVNAFHVRLGRRSDDRFDNISTVEAANHDSLIFINKPGEHTLEILKRPFAAALLEHDWGMKNQFALNEIDAAIFLVKRPRLIIARIISLLHPEEDQSDAGIHPTATVHPNARIHPSVSIGRHCIIGKCEIGENSRIEAHTTVKNDVVIGKNVIIREYCLIGGCGFGFARDELDRLMRIPHIGRVIIEDYVEIFPYVNIDRATLGETRVKRGAKIDHYSHIGHNSTIGEDTIITAGTVFCGGSRIGNRSWAGVRSIIREKISVGNEVTLGLGSVVVENIENGVVAAGHPAKPMKKEQ